MLSKSALNKSAFWGTLVGFGFLLGAISGALAAELPAEHSGEYGGEHNMTSPATANPFQRIDQPLINKMAVTLGGLGLIGLELWWFLLSKPKSQTAQAQDGIQEVAIIVDGGYEPSRIVVQAGQPVRLNFLRRDPSSCLEEVRLPDFHIAQSLTLNQTTAVEFTPTAPGSYEFACGMNMFRGVIEVTSTQVASEPENSSSQAPTALKQLKQEYSA